MKFHSQNGKRPLTLRCQKDETVKRSAMLGETHKYSQICLSVFLHIQWTEKVYMITKVICFAEL